MNKDSQLCFLLTFKSAGKCDKLFDRCKTEREIYMNRLYDELIKYSSSDYYAFHMPGHKRNLDYVNGDNPFKYDITEIEGFDNLYHATGILKEEMDNAAGFFGSDRTYFLVNGSTCGILAAISAAAEPGEKIIVGRNSHKSVYNAVFLENLRPVYVYPQVVCSVDISGAYNLKEIEDVISDNTDAAAVVLTSPTYDGAVSDIKSISDIAHRFNIPVIVDQAHGAHFGMHQEFPESAITLGADIVITSLHKTLMSLTQTALLHIKSSIIDSKKVERYLSIYQSSSPSYVLMSSIADCIHTLQYRGDKIFEAYVKRLREFRESCKNLKNLFIFESGDFDPSKVIIFIRNNVISGRQLYERLLEVYHLQMEMAASDYVLAMTSPADTAEGFSRFSIALHEIDMWIEEKFCGGYMNRAEMAEMCGPDGVCRLTGRHESPDVVMTFRAAASSETQSIDILKAEGCISAEFVYLYPPGIPMIVPGEKITEQIVKDIETYRRQGLSVQGPEDIDAGKIKTVKSEGNV